MAIVGRKCRWSRNSGSPSSLRRSFRRSFQRSEGDASSLIGGVSFSDGVSCSDAMSVNDETILINVGGQVFETYISTLNRLACKCKMTNEVFLRRHFRSAHGDFFFDRDPEVFKYVLNFLRTGQLHLPRNSCAATIHSELSFWGAREDDIEGCCWSRCSSWQTQKTTFDNMEKWLMSTRTTQEWSSLVLSPWQRIRHTTWNVLDDPFSSTSAKVFSWFSLVLAFGSIFVFCAETHPAFQVCVMKTTVSQHGQNSTNEIIAYATGPVALCKNGMGNNPSNMSRRLQPHAGLAAVDFAILFFFTMEFLLRILCSPAKVDFLLSTVNILDFLALLPDYVELLVTTFATGGEGFFYYLHFLFTLRILRVFRIFRLFRRVHGLRVFVWMLTLSVRELFLVVLYLIVSDLIIGSLIYFAEKRATTDFTNIPMGLWWAVVTMTTVGYGDVVPKTSLGMILASVCFFNGVLILTLTMALTVGNFLLHRPQLWQSLHKKCKSSAQSDVTLTSAGRTNRTKGHIVQCCSNPLRPPSGEDWT